MKKITIDRQLKELSDQWKKVASISSISPESKRRLYTELKTKELEIRVDRLEKK